MNCLGILRDFVDFVDQAAGDGNISRAPLLPWWAKFVEGCEKAKIRLDPEPEKDIRTAMERFFDRLLPFLYLIRHGLGKDLNELVDSAYHRLTGQHHLKLKRLQELTQQRK